MSITIKDYYDGLKQYVNKKRDDIQTLKQNIEQLEKDPKIIEYLRLKDELEMAEDGYSFNWEQFSYDRQKKDCHHPMVMLEYDLVSLNALDIYSQCLICGNVINLNNDDMKNLYTKKRLIAKPSNQIEKIEYNSEFVPISKITKEKVRELYYNLYIQAENLDDIASDFSIEDMLWNYYCLNEPLPKELEEYFDHHFESPNKDIIDSQDESFREPKIKLLKL